MISDWRYRTAALAGAVSLTAVAVLVANTPPFQNLFVETPLSGRLLAISLSGGELLEAVLTVVAVAAIALVPLYKPRPRRVVDTIALTHRRVLLLTFALATIGYFDYTYRIPRTTLVVTAALLAVVLPAWFVLIRRWLRHGEERAIIVGDDVERFPRIRELAERPVLGYVAPTVSPSMRRGVRQIADGGSALLAEETPALERLGGLSRLDGTLVEYDPDVAIMAFVRPDRQEFFGTLHTCHRHGVTAKITRDHVDSVLSADERESDELVTIDLEPWDWQDIAIKRAFDLVFATVGLVVLSPVMLGIAAAIRADDGGPVFYSQRRTSSFGETYTVYKFRTMEVESEDEAPVDDEDNDRITRVGRVLRRSHLDEIPQLLTVISGEMSVVGPRAAWTDEEAKIEDETVEWRKRWFVKPGLTGLAQVNGVTSTQPETKLSYDVQYIREQSFWFDCRIVGRQFEAVLTSLLELVEDARQG